MKTYYALKFNPKENGQVIELNPEAPKKGRLRDYIASYSNPENNLQFRLLEGTRGTYEATIPEMRFTSGGGPTAISPAVSPGWYRDGQRRVRLRLDSAGLSALEKGVYVEKISQNKAREMKQDEFNWSMQLLWIAGA
jgi:hypothetical protein